MVPTAKAEQLLQFLEAVKATDITSHDVQVDSEGLAWIVGYNGTAAYDTTDINLTGVGEPELIQGAVITASLFPALGATAHVGRTLLAADEQPGGEQVVVISHALWQRRFGGDPAVAGRRVTLGRANLRSLPDHRLEPARDAARRRHSPERHDRRRICQYYRAGRTVGYCREGYRGGP